MNPYLRLHLKGFASSTANWRKLMLAAIALAAAVAITAGFYYSLIPYGFDWITFTDTGRRLITGVSLYSTMTSFAWFSNPPWIAVIMVPFSLLPLRVGWAVMSTLNLAVCGALAWKYKLSPAKLALLISSPPVIYTLINGQIDLMVLLLLLLPSAFWPIAAITKPQVGLGLLFPVKSWRKAILVGVCVVAITMLLFGPWPLELIRQPKSYVNSPHNFWLTLFPYCSVIGVAFIVQGIKKKDERHLLLGSPFILPYATTGNFAGAWLALSCLLETWQVAAVWLAWWGATAYRLIG
jgi:hypothetical protein